MFVLNFNMSILIYSILRPILYFLFCEILNVEAEVLQSSEKLVISEKFGRIDDEVLPCRLINDCEIRCLPSNLGDGAVYTAAIESIYNDAVTSDADCGLHGVKLVLPKQAICKCIYLMSNFLAADIKIRDLDVDLNLIYQISSDAFESDKFSGMKNLTLRNGNLEELYRSVFTGLSLEKLVLTNHSFCEGRFIQPGVLELLNDTLKSFTLIEAVGQIQIPIERIVGSGSKTLPNIEYVKIQYKMNSTNAFTFTAIPNVKVLDLSASHISMFNDEYPFEMLTKLEILNLENNQLKTLPAGIFDVFFASIPTEFLSIRLSGNPWICGCDLEHLKYLMGNFSNFEGDVLCDTPTDIHDYPIKDTIFCPQIQTTSSTLSTSTTSTTPTESPATTTISSINFTEKECISYINPTYKENVLIQSQLSYIQLTKISGEVSISLEDYDTEQFLIWFSTNKIRNDFPVYQANDNIDCLNVTKEFVIRNLIEGTPYTFCLLRSGNSKASPLDCVSYHEEIKPWLFERSRPLTFGIMSAVFLASILIGSLLGTFIGMKCIFGGEEIGCTIENDSSDHISMNIIAENHKPPPLPRRSRCNSYAYVT